jgi:hypothetical protein
MAIFSMDLTRGLSGPSLRWLFGVDAGCYFAVAVIPVLCRSLEQVANFLRQNFSSTQLFKYYTLSYYLEFMPS